MRFNKTLIIFFATAFLIALTATKGPEAWTSPSDAADDQEASIDVPSGSDLWGDDQFESEPATDLNPILIGTAVVEGGSSYAVFQSGGRSVLVREGDEIIEGLLLVYVGWGEIDVERDGVIDEILIASGEAVPGDGVLRETGIRRAEEVQAQRIKARQRVRFLTNFSWRK